MRKQIAIGLCVVMGILLCGCVQKKEYTVSDIFGKTDASEYDIQDEDGKYITIEEAEADTSKVGYIKRSDMTEEEESVLKEIVQKVSTNHPSDFMHSEVPITSGNTVSMVYKNVNTDVYNFSDEEAMPVVEENSYSSRNASTKELNEALSEGYEETYEETYIEETYEEIEDSSEEVVSTYQNRAIGDTVAFGGMYCAIPEGYYLCGKDMYVNPDYETSDVSNVTFDYKPNVSKRPLDLNTLTNYLIYNYKAQLGLDAEVVYDYLSLNSQGTSLIKLKVTANGTHYTQLIVAVQKDDGLYVVTFTEQEGKNWMDIFHQCATTITA